MNYMEQMVGFLVTYLLLLQFSVLRCSKYSTYYLLDVPHTRLVKLSLGAWGWQLSQSQSSCMFLAIYFYAACVKYLSFATHFNGCFDCIKWHELIPIPDSNSELWTNPTYRAGRGKELYRLFVQILRFDLDKTTWLHTPKRLFLVSSILFMILGLLFLITSRKIPWHVSMSS